MLRNDTVLKRFLKLPADLSDAEADRLIQQARYDTFRQRGVSARAAAVNTIVAIVAMCCAAMFGLAVYLLTPLHAGGVVVKAILTGVSAGLAFLITHLVQQVYRARLLQPEVTRLLELRARPPVGD